MNPTVIPVSPNIPITVFTGFLGAGKTSIILSLLSQLPKDYKVVLLKNEFGDVEVDSKLAKQSSLAAVSEILNGCMCCVLVGQMKTALLEIREKYRPNRIIIECSGSAFPATLAFQIRELERETDSDLKLDGIVTVIDAENFTGYEDTSPTAKMQASYTDVILINKWEHISVRALDLVVDHLNTLNDLTPKINCKGRNGVDPNLIFGVDSKLFLEPGNKDVLHTDEVETITIYQGPSKDRPHAHKHHHVAKNLEDSPGGEGIHAERNETDGSDIIDIDNLTKALECLSKESVWRVKGFVKLNDGVHILNWAFGRFDLTKVEGGMTGTGSVRFTVMGERGEVKRASRKFAAALEAAVL